MKVLVDTPVWSLALRRSTGNLSPHEEKLKQTLGELIHDARVVMIGPIRQELLSGVREEPQFNRLRDHLRAFEDLEITTEDYERAASMSNRCQSSGIANSPMDMLICAVAASSHSPILTTDRDFSNYSKLLPIQLLA